MISVTMQCRVRDDIELFGNLSNGSIFVLGAKDDEGVMVPRGLEYAQHRMWIKLRKGWGQALDDPGYTMSFKNERVVFKVEHVSTEREEAARG